MEPKRVIVVGPDTLHAGEHTAFSARAILADDSDDVTASTVWSSSRPDIVTVNRANGGAVAVAPGVAQIAATADGLTGVLQVSVAP